MGRMVSLSTPDPGAGAFTQSLTLDGNGNITKTDDFKGTEHWYQYDALNRMLGHGASSSADDEEYSWNCCSSMSGYTDSFGTAVLTYDDLGRMLSSTDSAGSQLQYEYDALGRQNYEQRHEWSGGSWVSHYDITPVATGPCACRHSIPCGGDLQVAVSRGASDPRRGNLCRQKLRLKPQPQNLQWRSQTVIPWRPGLAGRPPAQQAGRDSAAGSPKRGQRRGRLVKAQASEVGD